MLYTDCCLQLNIILHQYSQNLQDFLVPEEQISSGLGVDYFCDSDLNGENQKAVESELESEKGKTSLTN